MWNTPVKTKTFTGPYALVLAYGLKEMYERLKYCLECNDEDDHHFGYRAYAQLTLEQKVWTLHRIAFGLLDRKTPIIPLTDYLEAGVATLFREVEGCIEVEIDTFRDIKNDEDKDFRNWCFSTRRAILAVHEKEGRNKLPFVEESEDILRLECEDIEQWRVAVEHLECNVLWDSDYDMNEFADMNPDAEEVAKIKLGIADDYFSTIPNDPKLPEVEKLMKEIAKLCDRVIKREEKYLQIEHTI
jgi:hypothetical protein